MVEDFAKYLYLPRVGKPQVLPNAIADGVALRTWAQDAFAFADSYDEAAGCYRGLRGGRMVTLPDPDVPGLLVRPGTALTQFDAERQELDSDGGRVPGDQEDPGEDPGSGGAGTDKDDERITPPKAARPKCFHGTVELDATRVGRDAGRIADGVVAHLAALVRVWVRVTLEIEAEIPDGASDHVVRTVTENSRVLKFTSQSFERE